MVRTLSVDGQHISSRLTNHTVRVVIASTPRALDVATSRPIAFDAPASPLSRRRRSEAAARRRAGWVPSSTLRNRRTGRKSKRAIVACDDVGARRGSPAPGW